MARLHFLAAADLPGVVLHVRVDGPDTLAVDDGLNGDSDAVGAIALARDIDCPGHGRVDWRAARGHHVGAHVRPASCSELVRDSERRGQWPAHNPATGGEDGDCAFSSEGGSGPSCACCGGRGRRSLSRLFLMNFFLRRRCVALPVQGRSGERGGHGELL